MRAPGNGLFVQTYSANCKKRSAFFFFLRETRFEMLLKRYNRFTLDIRAFF